MRFTVASALAMATTVSAHAQMYGIWVNGVDQGDGRKDYIRSPPNNSPVKDLTSPDLVCGPNGGTPVPSFAKAAAGDKPSFEWYHDNRDDDIIDGSHAGPLITYIAEYTETDGSGPIWTKIAEDGYSGGKWAVDKIKANHGKQDFTLPAGLAAGKYLVRQEIIAHHESDVAFASNPARGAQFYPSCVQLEVTEGGSAVPDEGFDFNTGYTSADPGIVFNLYSGYTSYTIPGPKVWTGAGSGSAPAPKPTTAAPVATTTAAPVTRTVRSLASAVGVTIFVYLLISNFEARLRLGDDGLASHPSRAGSSPAKNPDCPVPALRHLRNLELNLTDTITYTKRCIKPVVTRSLERDAVAQIDEPLLKTKTKIDL
ncbi:hypothetical protein BN1708_017542, partial [Verticillium longisporum]